jgi:hypothetical protein
MIRSSLLLNSWKDLEELSFGSLMTLHFKACKTIGASHLKWLIVDLRGIGTCLDLLVGDNS